MAILIWNPQYLDHSEVSHRLCTCCPDLLFLERLLSSHYWYGMGFFLLYILSECVVCFCGCCLNSALNKPPSKTHLKEPREPVPRAAAQMNTKPRLSSPDPSRAVVGGWWCFQLQCYQSQSRYNSCANQTRSCKCEIRSHHKQFPIWRGLWASELGTVFGLRPPGDSHTLTVWCDDVCYCDGPTRSVEEQWCLAGWEQTGY